MDNENYEGAIESFLTVSDYKDSKDLIEKCTNIIQENKYQSALVMLQDNNYLQAKEKFEELGDYKDSKEKIRVCQVGPYINAEVGDIIDLGDYSWKVLSRDGDQLFLITESCIAKRHFQKNQNDPKYYIDSPIRSWLDEIYNSSFSADEQELILTTEVISSGGNTQDKLFLLSDTEAEYYFSSNEDRQSKDKQTWFLRTVNPVKLAVLNYYSPIAMLVSAKGEIYQNDWTTDYERGVRPAMWIDVSSLR